MFRRFSLFLLAVLVLISCDDSSNNTTPVNLSCEILDQMYDGNTDTLALSDQSIAELPDCIGDLTSLLYVNVGYNDLTTLPASIIKLTNIEELNIRNNQFSVVPESIGELTSLKMLWMQDNQLTTIPDFIGNLTNLEWLHIAKNQLTSLPESIKNLTNLQELIVKDNNFSAEERAKIETWLPNCNFKWD